MKTVIHIAIFLLLNPFLAQAQLTDSATIKKLSINGVCLCKTTVSELKHSYPDLKEVEVEEMDVPKNCFGEDARYVAGKGYCTGRQPGLIFQKENAQSDYIGKIRLTEQFKGYLPDGQYIDFSQLRLNDVFRFYPVIRSNGSTRDCSEYLSYSNDTITFYVKIAKSQNRKLPIDTAVHFSKLIAGIDLVVSCYGFQNHGSIELPENTNAEAMIFDSSSFNHRQQGKFNPFTLLIIKPETAIVDKSLYSDMDSVEANYLQRYYAGLKQMEDLINFKDYPPSMSAQFEQTNEELKKRIPLIKAQEPEVKKFKYYQTLSSYSTEVYNSYFNEYEPFSSIIELPNQKTDIASLNRLADTANANYIVFFSDIHTQRKDGILILKLTTFLYSKKDRKIILTKETEGDTTSRGFMWSCGSTTLSCLLINGVRTSTDEVAPEIIKRQIRQ
jgi:hypothetical protein